MAVALDDSGVAITVVLKNNAVGCLKIRAGIIKRHVSKDKRIMTMKKLYRKRKHSGLHVTTSAIRISFGQSTSSAGTQQLTSENGRSILYYANQASSIKWEEHSDI